MKTKNKTAKRKSIPKWRKELDDTTLITAGATYDDNYSLAIQKYKGKPCICIHKCTKDGGWHYSTMNSSSLVAAIDFDHLKWIVNEIEGRKYLFDENYGK